LLTLTVSVYLLLLLYLLIGPCSVFYPVCLFSCDVQFSRQRDRLGGLEIFSFPFFVPLQGGYHPSCLHAPLLILGHLMTS
jgi:hypothetical protein